MSNQDVGDIRHQPDKLPPHLGKEPSQEALNSWFSDYGWVWLWGITNNSSQSIDFYNPYYKLNSKIAPGTTESYNSKGYIPLWSHSSRYEILYYKLNVGWRKIFIKDLEGDYLLSFEEQGVNENIRKVRPDNGANPGGIKLTINDTGYEITIYSESVPPHF